MINETAAFAKEQWVNFVESLQDEICQALEAEDGKAKFVEDIWKREGGGSGKTRVIQNGNVFEKGGVNTSVVYGEVTEAMRKQLGIGGHSWFAAGISIVIHPLNPFVPTVHCNYRMFELYDEAGSLADRWFGGGTDITPYYLFEEDVRSFHRIHKTVCDSFDNAFYPDFKKACDNYFLNTHRGNERRGAGGIFFDHQRPGADKDVSFWFRFAESCGKAFIHSYLPIVARRKNTAYGNAETYWQEIRRGRYVEFNLVHDRGTLFGLKTNGRTESILMSLPPTVRFDYNFQPVAGSEEARLLDACLHPREWV